jgi:hypothetical protein
VVFLVLVAAFVGKFFWLLLAVVVTATAGRLIGAALARRGAMIVSRGAGAETPNYVRGQTCSTRRCWPRMSWSVCTATTRRPHGESRTGKAEENLCSGS